MIANIEDNREHRHRWKCVNVVLEATWLDNSVKDSDQAPRGDYTYSDRDQISLTEAIAWANSFEEPVTLYIYDAPNVEEAPTLQTPEVLTVLPAKLFVTRVAEIFGIRRKFGASA